MERKGLILGGSLIIAVAVAVSFIAISEWNKKDTVGDKTPKDGFSVENTVKNIDEKDAELLYYELDSEIADFQNSEEGSVFELLGSEVSDKEKLAEIDNIRTNENYISFCLDNGGKLGYNQELGIVHIDNFKRGKDIAHEKSLDAVVKTISDNLNLDDYIVAECGPYQEQQNYYRIVWQKALEGDCESNPYDSVWVLLDSETYQLLYLERYSYDVNTTKAQITKEQAFDIAVKQLLNIEEDEKENAEIELTCVKVYDEDKVKKAEESLVILAYVFKTHETKVVVDATTGEIISDYEAEV